MSQELVECKEHSYQFQYLVQTTNPSFEQGGNLLVISARIFLSESQHISGAQNILPNETTNEENIHKTFLIKTSFMQPQQAQPYSCDLKLSHPQQTRSYSCCSHKQLNPTISAPTTSSILVTIPRTNSTLKLLHPKEKLFLWLLHNKPCPRVSRKINTNYNLKCQNYYTKPFLNSQAHDLTFCNPQDNNEEQYVFLILVKLFKSQKYSTRKFMTISN